MNSSKYSYNTGISNSSCAQEFRIVALHGDTNPTSEVTVYKAVLKLMDNCKYDSKY